MGSTKGTLTIRLPADLRDDLERLARKADRSLSGEVRYALRQHVKRPPETKGSA